MWMIKQFKIHLRAQGEISPHSWPLTIFQIDLGADLQPVLGLVVEHIKELTSYVNIRVYCLAVIMLWKISCPAFAIPRLLTCTFLAFLRVYSININSFKKFCACVRFCNLPLTNIPCTLTSKEFIRSINWSQAIADKELYWGLIQTLDSPAGWADRNFIFKQIIHTFTYLSSFIVYK